MERLTLSRADAVPEMPAIAPPRIAANKNFFMLASTVSNRVALGTSETTIHGSSLGKTSAHV
jgi:hypothetical protein